MSYRRDEVAKQQLAALRERMNQLFEDGELGGEPTWVPPADVYRARDLVVINVELPGVDEGAIGIDANGRTLRVHGQRPASPGERGALQLERSYGPFVREFLLPEGARPAERRVRCEDGVLRIEIPIG